MRKGCCFAAALAWVMWIRTQGPGTDSWSGVSGHPTRERCLASVRQQLDVWRQYKDAVFSENAVTFTGTNTTFSYFCLPETEDPRPKGKR
ncbi:MAG TPA: hypothetical protein VNO43_01450 [Candidatus Eisenbacteria bacterium]|nr:hypothetical protein [Candidatus Eisenbacteria bacterium]